MKTDIYLKAVLTVIAVCLVALTIRSAPLISAAKAEGSTHCTGSLNVSSFGATTPMSGGYDVDVTCN